MTDRMSDSEIEDTTYHTDDEWLYKQWELAREAENELEIDKQLRNMRITKLEKENIVFKRGEEQITGAAKILAEFVGRLEVKVAKLEKENAECKASKATWMGITKDYKLIIEGHEKENAELKETMQDWKNACRVERELVESKNHTIESLRSQNANEMES